MARQSQDPEPGNWFYKRLGDICVRMEYAFVAGAYRWVQSDDQPTQFTPNRTPSYANDLCGSCGNLKWLNRCPQCKGYKKP